MVHARQGLSAALVISLVALGACSSSDSQPPIATPSPSVAPTTTESPSASPTNTVKNRGEDSTAPGSKESTSPTAQPATTLVTLSLSGPGWRDWNLQPYVTVNGKTKRYGAEATLYGGSLTWKVPTSLTPHLSFGYDDLTFDSYLADKNAFVVMSYEGVPPGTKLSPDQAGSKTYASPCWVGTKKSRITLYVRAESSPASPTRSPLVYTNPTAGSSGNFLPTIYGGLILPGSQTPICD